MLFLDGVYENEGSPKVILDVSTKPGQDQKVAVLLRQSVLTLSAKKRLSQQSGKRRGHLQNWTFNDDLPMGVLYPHPTRLDNE